MILDNFLSRAINNLAPNASWYIPENVIEDIVWNSPEIQQPTTTEIEAEMSRLQAEYDNNEYQRQRATAYPSIADQLDTIYHEGIDAWKATIAAVKQEYPKP